MKEVFKNLMNLDKPILTKKLAPALTPFARLIYLIGLIILSLACLGALYLLFKLEVSEFLLSLIGICAEFALLRMFCEYLVSSGRK
ncbi:MAG: hypothetical protein E7021_03030 [Alphaproteobacteria bacterium]|nr:hypothetical protein [Alphaproteobacteria bacterium]